MSEHQIRALFAMGAQLINSNQFEAAETVFFRLTMLRSDLGQAHLGLGLALQGQSKYQAALVAFGQASILTPNDSKSLFCAAQCLCFVDKPGLALRALQSAKRRISEETPAALCRDIGLLYAALASSLEVSNG